MVLCDENGFEPLAVSDPTGADEVFASPLASPRSTYLADEKLCQVPFPAPDVSYVDAAVFAAPRLAGVEDLLAGYQTGRLDPVAVLNELKSDIETVPSGKAAVLRFVPGWDRAAREAKRRWQDGTARPLEGIPFGVKDIIDVAGTKVACGSHFTGDRVAPADAEVVSRLRRAGAIPFAMTATTEFAAGGPHNPRFGPVLNPWDESRWTGGSSTGSGAALAARLLPLTLGTDTGGSIRVPSCWCGTSGLKPGRERVSRKGVAPLSWTLDHVGPMARSVRDIARVLPFMTAVPDAALARDCAGLLGQRALAGVRVGVPRGWFDDVCDSRVLDNWILALAELERLGAILMPLSMPENLAACHEAGWIILQSELASLHGDRLDRADLFDPGLLARLKTGLGFSARDYGNALQLRKKAQSVFMAMFDDIDVLVTPGLGGEAGSLDTLTVDVDGAAMAFQDVIPRNTMMFDLTGLPALMMPSGMGRSGLPTGIQIVALPRLEARALQVGKAFQDVTAHHLAVPGGAAVARPAP